MTLSDLQSYNFAYFKHFKNAKSRSAVLHLTITVHCIQQSQVHWLSLSTTIRYNTIRYDILTCVQKLTRWPA